MAVESRLTERRKELLRQKKERSDQSNHVVNVSHLVIAMKTSVLPVCKSTEWNEIQKLIMG
jgi:hypothetical protein